MWSLNENDLCLAIAYPLAVGERVVQNDAHWQGERALRMRGNFDLYVASRFYVDARRISYGDLQIPSRYLRIALADRIHTRWTHEYREVTRVEKDKTHSGRKLIWLNGNDVFDRMNVRGMLQHPPSISKAQS